MEIKFTKKEIALFDKVIEIYDENPNLALALLEDDAQLERFREYNKTKIDHLKILRDYLEYEEGDSHES